MKYELSFIISSAIPESEHNALNQDILGYLKEIKAEVIKEPYFLGRRKLAYPIKKQKHGFYAFLEFATDNKSDIKELDLKLRHNNKLLRHLIIKLDRVAIEAAKDEPIKFQEKPALAKRSDRIFKAKERVQVKDEAKAKPEEKKEPVSVNLDDIDKKLDDILKEPNLD